MLSTCKIGTPAKVPIHAIKMDKIKNQKENALWSSN